MDHSLEAAIGEQVGKFGVGRLGQAQLQVDVVNQALAQVAQLDQRPFGVHVCVVLRVAAHVGQLGEPCAQWLKVQRFQVLHQHLRLSLAFQCLYPLDGEICASLPCQVNSSSDMPNLAIQLLSVW